jgi:hypothetical protein
MMPCGLVYTDGLWNGFYTEDGTSKLLSESTDIYQSTRRNITKALICCRQRELIGKMDLREIGCEDGRWMELAQDRVQWQALVLEIGRASCRERVYTVV